MKMFISDVIIQPEHYDKNPYSIHKLLWEMFPAAEGEARSFLYRATPSLDGKLHVLLQSPIRPQLDARHNTVCELASCEEKDLTYKEGEKYQFVLLANPTRTVDKKRIPVTYEHGLKRWLSSKLGGSAIVGITVPLIQPSFVFKKDGNEARIHSVLFVGALHILDVTLFEEILIRGIGSAKFLGFGLMTLQRCFDPVAINFDV